MRQKGAELAGFRGQLHGQDLGTIGAYLSALHPAVVEEDEAIEPQIEICSQATEVFRLRLPVHLRGGKMLPLQHHAWMLGEDRTHIGLFIFAHQDQQKAGRATIDQKLLELSMSLLDYHPQRPVLAADPAPESVVGVYGDHLEVGLLPRQQCARHLGP